MTCNEKVRHFIDIFNVNTDLSEVKFNEIHIELYNSPPNTNNNTFGEELCSVCKCSFTTYHINVSFKVLFFVYESHAEVLKLEINIENQELSKEIAGCKNFLQRKRNLNLAFEILVKFAKLFESRRLILDTVLRKYLWVNIESTDDAGFEIKCFSKDYSKLLVGIEWSLSWDVNKFEASDSVHFHCKNDILDQAKMVKFQTLVKPLFDFHFKLKVWKLLMKDLYDSDLNVSVVDLTEELVLELPDSDAEDVIEIKEERVEEIIL